MPEIHVWHWAVFGGLIAFLLTVNLSFWHYRAREPSPWETAGWPAFWIVLSLGFNALVWRWLGRAAALDYLTGYLVEEFLSLDNLFVFIVIFRYFQVPRIYHYRILYWGIVGAIFLRLAFILVGTSLIGRFDFVLAVFGVFLLYTALRLAREPESNVHPEKNVVLRIARRFCPVTRGDDRQYGGRFFAREDGRLRATPLFLVLLVVESSDLLFAVDSVPAIFGITTEPFLVFTSNVFAILGLRAMYFFLSGVMERFRYLRFGIAAVLGFVGAKMVVEFAFREFWALEGRLIPSWVSLLAVVALLSSAVLASIAASRREKWRTKALEHSAEAPETGPSARSG